MTTNLQLAKSLADFADALAEYNHLPPLSLVSLPVAGKAFARLSYKDADADLIRQVAVWADLFAAPVKFDLSGDGYATVSAVVEVAGRQVDVSAVLSREGLRAAEADHGLDTATAGAVTEVPAGRLLAALNAEAVA